MKVLSYALSTSTAEGAEVARQLCNTLVDSGGLKTVGAMLMKTPTHSQPKGSQERRPLGVPAAQLEEHVLSVLAALLRHTSGIQRQRVLNKFSENEHAKLERIVELRIQFWYAFDANAQSHSHVH